MGARVACPTCGGKGFVNEDGSLNNAFEGLDRPPVSVFIPCPDCGYVARVIADRIRKEDLHTRIEESRE
jgi:DNA-directed RNA polymerase subunit RPC12/RpoP